MFRFAKRRRPEGGVDRYKNNDNRRTGNRFCTFFSRFGVRNAGFVDKIGVFVEKNFI